MLNLQPLFPESTVRNLTLDEKLRYNVPLTDDERETLREALEDQQRYFVELMGRG